MNGFTPGQLSLTAVGEQMRVRYPEGFHSSIDADLWLRGDVASPTLGGTVMVHDARLDAPAGGRSRASSTSSAAADRACRPAPAAAPALPLRLRHPGRRAPTRCGSRTTSPTCGASADLKLQGTYDRPALFGRAEIDRGSIVFEGNRYVVTRGTVDFLTPPGGRIEPIFDIEAETRVRVPSQTFRITLGVSGTTSSLVADARLGSAAARTPTSSRCCSAPTTDVNNAELRALSPDAVDRRPRKRSCAAVGARLLTGPLSAPVRRVVEETLRARDGADRADLRHRQRSADAVGAADSRQAPVVARLL